MNDCKHERKCRLIFQRDGQPAETWWYQEQCLACGVKLPAIERDLEYEADMALGRVAYEKACHLDPEPDDEPWETLGDHQKSYWMYIAVRVADAVRHEINRQARIDHGQEHT